MLNFKKIMSAILVSAMAVSGMSTVASAKTVLNGVKVFDDSFVGGNATFTYEAYGSIDTTEKYSGDASFVLKGNKPGEVVVEYETPVDLSGIWDTESISMWVKPTGSSAPGFEFAVYDTEGRKIRYMHWGNLKLDEWQEIEFALKSPYQNSEDCDTTKISKIFMNIRDWSNNAAYYFDDILIGTETEMPGQVRDKVVRVIYDDKFDDAITWNRQAYRFDKDEAFADEKYDGEATLKLTATDEGWRQMLAGGKKLDLSADWENAYLEFYVKASAEGAFNVRVTYNNGAAANPEVAVGSNAYVCTPTTDEFTKVSIPLTTYADLEAYKDVITGFSIQGGAANNGQTIYVDNVCFVVKEETPSLEATMADGVITATTSASEGIIIAAVFNGDKFVRAQSVPAPEVDPSTTINIGALAEGETVKVMLFDSLTGIYPVADSVTL